MNRVRYAKAAHVTGARPLVAHVTTTDISLELLLGPQLEAFAAAGFEVVGVSAPGPVRRGARSARASGTCRCSTRRDRSRRSQDARALAELVVGVPPAPARDRAHAQPEAGPVRPGRGARRRACPVVVNTVHGLYAQPEDPFAEAGRGVLDGTRRRAVLARRARAEPRGHRDARAASACPRRKLTLLGNGIDLTRFDPATVTADDARGRARGARRVRARRRRGRAGRPARAREGLPRGVRRGRAAARAGARTCGSR